MFCEAQIAAVPPRARCFPHPAGRESLSRGGRLAQITQLDAFAARAVVDLGKVDKKSNENMIILRKCQTISDVAVPVRHQVGRGKPLLAIIQNKERKLQNKTT